MAVRREPSEDTRADLKIPVGNRERSEKEHSVCSWLSIPTPLDRGAPRASRGENSVLGHPPELRGSLEVPSPPRTRGVGEAEGALMQEAPVTPELVPRRRRT